METENFRIKKENEIAEVVECSDECDDYELSEDYELELDRVSFEIGKLPVASDVPGKCYHYEILSRKSPFFCETFCAAMDSLLMRGFNVSVNESYEYMVIFVERNVKNDKIMSYELFNMNDVVERG